MPGRKKAPIHTYSVFVSTYATQQIKDRVVRGEDYLTQPEQLESEIVYFGNSERQAGYAFYRAARASMNNPLAYAVEMKRDMQVIVRVRV